jgi:hypothetical protein
MRGGFYARDCFGTFFPRAPAIVAASERPIHSWSEWKQQLRQGATIPLVLLFFLYVGTEAGVGGWVAALEKRLPVSGHASALTIAASVFYGLLLLGRGLAPFGLRHFSTVTISLAGLLSASAGTAMIALANSTPILIVGAAMAGIGCAPQYPIIADVAGERSGKDADWLERCTSAREVWVEECCPSLWEGIATQSHSLCWIPCTPGGEHQHALALRVRACTHLRFE